MARVSLRTVSNKSGVTYDSAKTTVFFAEDYEKIKDAIEDATSGINTEQVEVGGKLAVSLSGSDIIFGDTTSGNYIKIDTTNNKISIYVNNVKVVEWS